MTILFTIFRMTIPTCVAGIALIVAGCTETTTREDIADARAALEQEQEETAEVIREGEDDIAQARQEAYEARKPVIEQGREDVAEIEREVSEAIREQQKEEQAAAEKLRAAENNFHARQERDFYVTKVEHRLADIELEIEQLEERASKAEGADKENLDLQIKTLQTQYERAEEALEELRSAELDEMDTHEQSVRMAMQDLNSTLNNIR